MHRIITMHARLGQTVGQMDEHHGNSATIRSDERIARWKLLNNYKRNGNVIIIIVVVVVVVKNYYY